MFSRSKLQRSIYHIPRLQTRLNITTSKSRVVSLEYGQEDNRLVSGVIDPEIGQSEP